jgi:hypothetical protein
VKITDNEASFVLFCPCCCLSVLSDSVLFSYLLRSEQPKQSLLCTNTQTYTNSSAFLHGRGESTFNLHVKVKYVISRILKTLFKCERFKIFRELKFEDSGLVDLRACSS